jgi:hypothetical protein
MFMPAVYKETATEFGTAKGGNRWKMFMPACGVGHADEFWALSSAPHHQPTLTQDVQLHPMLQKV